MVGKTQTSVDNPEYIMNQSDPVSVATAVPNTRPVIDCNNVGLPLPPNGNIPRYPMTQRSSEEESDHEYYNDFDRLQRELQPLKPFRRNETTVWVRFVFIKVRVT
jgi:epidermal growth factor receptor